MGISTGSSPRVRGTPLQLIPFVRLGSVHPRVCGEHEFAQLDPSYVAGSSPRVRGTHEQQRRGIIIERFIPACAGNTGLNTIAAIIATVHPRVCGEHSHRLAVDITVAGSSPRVRGTPQTDSE